MRNIEGSYKGSFVWCGVVLLRKRERKMDLWVVAAAAGAGYLGKHLQNLSLSEREKLVQSYSKISNLRQSEPGNLLQQIRDKTCPLRRLARNGVLREPSWEQNDVLDSPLETDQVGGGSDSSLGIGRASTSENVLRLSSPAPGFSGRESISRNTESFDVSSRSSCRLCRSKLHKSRSSGNVLEHLGSLESNLEKVDEYVHSSFPTSPTTTIGPLSVRDGNPNMRQSNENSFGLWSNEEEDTVRYACWNENDGFSSASSSNNLKSVELQKDVKGSQERAHGGVSQSSDSSTCFDEGLTSGMLLFLIGLTIGIMPEAFTYTREIKKLNEQLKQAENLVQDLQEELDMKDKLTMKELTAEGSQHLSTKTSSPFSQKLTVSCSEPEATDMTSYDSKMANSKKEENRRSMSKIEAELEAELERLGLNMDLERTSDFIEVDPQNEVDTIQVDINLDASIRRLCENALKPESDGETITINGRTPPANYSVSPRELSIRLHEVIESRLEARIKELETALQNNQHKFHSSKSQSITSLSSAYSDAESVSTPESPHQLHRNGIDTLDEVKGWPNKMMGKDPETNHSPISPEVPPFERKIDDVPYCRNNGLTTSLIITEDEI